MKGTIGFYDCAFSLGKPFPLQNIILQEHSYSIHIAMGIQMNKARTLSEVITRNTNKLSPTLTTINLLIGATAAANLVEKYGGRRLYIPRKTREDHPIAEIIGIENMHKLCNEYDGLRISIPFALNSIIADRDQEICEKHNQKSIRQLAEEYKISERHLQRIISAGKSTKIITPTKTFDTSAGRLPWFR